MWILNTIILFGFYAKAILCGCTDHYNPYSTWNVSVDSLDVMTDSYSCGVSFCLLTCPSDSSIVAQVNGVEEYYSNALFDSTKWTGIKKIDNSSTDFGTSGATIGCLKTFRCIPYIDAKGVEHSSKCTANDVDSTCNEDRSMPMCTCSPLNTGDTCGISLTGLLTATAWLGTVVLKMLTLTLEGKTGDAIAHEVMPTLYSFYPQNIRENMSWTVDDMIESVVYEMDELDTRDVFTRVYDEVNGNCYTFNYSNRTNNVEGLFNARFAGQYRDFSAMLKFIEAEQVAWIPTNAMVVYIHAPGTPPKQGLRYSIQAGSSASIALKKSITKLISNCIDSVAQLNQSYYDDGEYTIEGCFSSCYQDKVFSECGCMDARIKKNDSVSHCTFAEETCVANVTDFYGEPSRWPECHCPQACYQEYYTMLATRGDFPIKGPACDDKVNGCVASNKQWARISIYMESLESQVYEESSKSSFTTLLSQSGGLLGVCLGMGVVGIIEILLLCGKLGAQAAGFL